MVYAIRNDDHNFQQLDFNIMDLLAYKPSDISIQQLIAFERHNLSLKKWWPTDLEFAFYAPRSNATKIPDVSVWTGSTLALSPRASRLLGAKLDQFGERLPFYVEGEQWELFNCHSTVDADSDLTEFHEPAGHHGSVKKLGFSSVPDEVFIFKCPQEGSLTPFAVEVFKDTLESFELEGVTLDSNLVEFPD